MLFLLASVLFLLASVLFLLASVLFNYNCCCFNKIFTHIIIYVGTCVPPYFRPRKRRGRKHGYGYRIVVKFQIIVFSIKDNFCFISIVLNVRFVILSLNEYKGSRNILQLF